MKIYEEELTEESECGGGEGQRGQRVDRHKSEAWQVPHIPRLQILTESQSTVPRQPHSSPQSVGGRKFPSFPVCLQDFLKVVFQISPGCVRLQLSDCQTFLRLPRRLPSCIHQKVSRQQFRKIWKSFQTMFDFFIYAVNLRNTCHIECIYMSTLHWQMPCRGE